MLKLYHCHRHPNKPCHVAWRVRHPHINIHQLDDKNGNAKWMHKTTTGIHSLTTEGILFRKVYKYGHSKFLRRFTTIGYRFHPFEGEVSFFSFFSYELASSSFCCNLESHPFVVVCTLQGTNISHLGKRKIIFKSALVLGYVSSQEGTIFMFFSVLVLFWKNQWIQQASHAEPTCLPRLHRKPHSRLVVLSNR